MFADQLDVAFLDDSSALHCVIDVPTPSTKSVDFSFLDNELFGSGTELEDACSVFTGSEDYSRMLLEWQQHMGLIGSNLVDFDDPLSGSCFKDSQYVPSFGDNVGTANSKDIAALEADDLDSLLARFEASQAADWLLNDFIAPVEPLVPKPTVNCADSEEYPESSVIEEVIVDADDEAEYIDVEEVEEEVECTPCDDGALVEQHNVDLDHDYCLVVTTSESDVEVDIEEDNSVSGFYNKIPSYYHETVLLRGNSSASSSPPENVTEEIVLEGNPASPHSVGDAIDNGLYCRLPPYIAECLSSAVKTKPSDLNDNVGSCTSLTESDVPSRLEPSSETGVLLSSCPQTDANSESKDEQTILNIKAEDSFNDYQVTDCASVASPVQDEEAAADTASDSPNRYGDNDEYCRYYERKSRRRHRHQRERKARYNRYSSSRSPTRSRSSCSRSSSSSSSKSSSRSRTWSHSRSRSRSPLNRRYSSRSSSSRREDKEERLREWRRNKMRPIEERRIIYVGNISSGTTRNDLRRRFSVFGPIEEVTVHFRDHGDDYGFVTFLYKVDAFEALAHGNDDRSQPQYDLCFGGRRHFCQSSYADLDGLNAAEQNSFSSPQPQASTKRVESDFDAMLRAAQASRQSKLQKGHS